MLPKYTLPNMTIEAVRRMFLEKNPGGSISLSKKVGGATRTFAVTFEEGGKLYCYSGSPKDLARKLGVLQWWGLRTSGERGTVILSHWDKDELLRIAKECNSERFAKEREEALRSCGMEFYRHPVYSVVMVEES
jgi:hypothetical protein